MQNWLRNGFITALPKAIVFASMTICAYLVLRQETWLDLWSEAGLRSFLWFSLVFFFVAGLLKLVAPLRARGWLLLSSIVFLVLGISIGPLAATVLFAFGSVGMGWKASRWNGFGQSAFVSNFFIGMALNGFIFAVLLHSGVLRQELVVLVLFCECLWAVNYIKQAWHMVTHWVWQSDTIMSWTDYGLFAVSVFAVVYCATASWMPSVNWDDLAYHLLMASQVGTRGRYLFDVHTQIWAVAPFFGDLVHSALTVVGQSDARPALALLLYGSIGLNAAKLLVKFKGDRFSGFDYCLWAGVVSVPVLFGMLTSLQTELLTTAVLFAGARELLCSEESKRLNWVLLVSLAAILMGTKLTAVLIAGGFVLALLWWRNGEMPKWSWQGTVLLIAFFFIAFQSYIIAWKLTGNPFFPLFNEFFKSPLYPLENLSNVNYTGRATLVEFLKMLVLSSGYIEGRDGLLGALVPVTMLAALGAATMFPMLRRERAVVLFVAGCIVPLFAALQYLRYIAPLILLLATLGLGLCMRIGLDSTRTSKALWGVVALTGIVLNIALSVGYIWYLKEGTLRALSNHWRADRVSYVAPEIDLNRVINAFDGSKSRVVYDFDSPFGGWLLGTPIYVNSYSPHYRSLFRYATGDVEKMKRVLRDIRATHVVLQDTPQVGQLQLQRTTLKAALSQVGEPICTAGNRILYQIK